MPAARSNTTVEPRYTGGTNDLNPDGSSASEWISFVFQSGMVGRLGVDGAAHCADGTAQYPPPPLRLPPTGSGGTTPRRPAPRPAPGRAGCGSAAAPARATPAPPC